MYTMPSTKNMPHKLRNWLLSLIGILLLASIWEVTVSVRGKRDTLSLFHVFGYLRSGKDATLILAWSIFLTSLRTIAGFLAGAFIGTIIGYTMGVVAWVDTTFSSAAYFLHSLPSVTVIYLWAVVFSQGKALVPIVAFGCMWPVVLNIRDERSNIASETRDLMRLIDIPNWKRFELIMSRQLLPGLLKGMRISIGIALILSITVEMLITIDLVNYISDEIFEVELHGQPSLGLGNYIRDNFGGAGNYSAVVVGTMSAGGIGVVFYQAYSKLYEFVMSWQNLSVDDEL